MNFSLAFHYIVVAGVHVCFALLH